jgi:PPE-repeat protein
MSFLVSPPEIISALMRAGAGSEPMLGAAAAWDGLAAELGAAAQSFSSVTSGLAADAWQGPASAAMLSTSVQYSSVLGAAAAQAQTAAAQAQTIASEFEAALAATVHPAVVAANRNQLVQLVVSNLFGQNAPAIAATDFSYELMWAEDIAAMVGYHGGVSAAAAQLSTWAAALPSLAGGAPAAIANGSAASALSSLNSAAADPLGGLLAPIESVVQEVQGVFGGVQQFAIDVINAPTSLLFGQNLIPNGPQPTGGSATIHGNGTATTPLTVREGTEPIVDASVGTGSPVPLLVDTGSEGLVIPFTSVGGLFGLLQLGIPIGGGIGGYSGGLDYLYLTYNAPVNFGGGLVTAPTPVDVELVAFPTSIPSALNNGFTFQSFFATDGAAGVLGVGPNAGGPGPSIATQALPAPYSQGLLIDQPASQLVFGPQSNVVTQQGLGAPIATLTGSPITNLNVSVNGGPPQSVPSIVDSGGVDGTLPPSVNAPVGTPITVTDPTTGHTLYTFTNGVDYSPLAITSGLMNTGNLIFEQHPVYINYGADTSTVY